MDHLKDPILSSLCYDGLCNTGIYIIIHNYIISCAATFNGWNLKHVDIQYLSRKAAMAGHAMLSAAHLGPVDADEDPADHLRSKWLVQDNQIFVNWYGTYFLLLYVPCCVIVLLSYYHCTHLYIRCIISLFFLLGSHLKKQNIIYHHISCSKDHPTQRSKPTLNTSSNVIKTHQQHSTATSHERP